MSVEFGRCPDCGSLSLPVLPLAHCGHDAPPATAPLDSPGVVYSWTRVAGTGGPGRLVAMVDFFDGALRVSGRVVGADAVAIGDLVTAEPGTDTPYAFRPRAH